MPARSFLDGLDLPDMDTSPRPCPKPSSRLQEGKAEKKLTLLDERKFKTEVWLRDGGCCRKCGRKVLKTIGRDVARGEVHHVHGRTGDLRFESRCALLLCLEDHERVTGRVAEKWHVVGTKFITVAGAKCIDARAKVTFVRAA